MADDLRSLRIGHQISAKDMVAVIKELYPKYDKTIQSKCERGTEYGIELRQDAMDTLATRFFGGSAPIKPTVPKKDKHRLPCRISCRLSEDDYAKLQLLSVANGYDTMQDWIAHQVQLYLLQNPTVEDGDK